ncbi:hypothetical protein N7532_009183 [Penicillium argentinense]|uniref:Uncharacterized protein n=1 Tax=Penicillium argentinense TaxID=1131581 RepID=A0A9W9EYR4_9EURO|nr:uncharacterized protein N7532_009183 [Penicillium argentinense]KAJ5090499.1 hypothetical protein N7532_009183 [Penicillium argentinense]
MEKSGSRKFFDRSIFQDGLISAATWTVSCPDVEIQGVLYPVDPRLPGQRLTPSDASAPQGWEDSLELQRSLVRRDMEYADSPPATVDGDRAGRLRGSETEALRRQFSIDSVYPSGLLWRQVKYSDAHVRMTAPSQFQGSMPKPISGWISLLVVPVVTNHG